MTIVRPHGQQESFRQRSAESVSVFCIQLWTAALPLMGRSAAGNSITAASMRWKEDYNIIEESISKLSQKVSIKNRLFGWQFLKDVEGNLYSIDFNLRPFGGYDKGSYDWDISDQNWASYLFDNEPPKKIFYTDSIECIYGEKIKFGYAPWERLKNALQRPYIKEVETYDNI